MFEKPIIVKSLCKDCKNSLFNDKVQLCKLECDKFEKDIVTDCEFHTWKFEIMEKKAEKI